MNAARSLSLLVVLLVAPGLPAQEVRFQRDVKPILERSCVACHACYDAPCQLKMETWEGLDRGASKQEVYAASRLRDQDPTRLFQDALDTPSWRGKGFHSVLEGGQSSLMSQMLALGRHNLMKPNAPIPDHITTGVHRENTCATTSEFDDYAEDRPQEGMPLGMTPLRDEEYETLQRWLAEGAPLEPRQPEGAGDRADIEAWERFLNGTSPREQLVSRYLYEHLYLAHLYLDGLGSTRFYQMVRSRTPPGRPIEPVEAVRPNSDPGGEFWYRIRRVPGTIVHKTHITFPFGPEKRARYQELFLDTEWDAGELPGYGKAESANPFETFRALPAESRYRFMLDDALFFVRTFIRGPVCRGQIATDVIEDHFHALFQAPEHDRFLHDPEYADAVRPLLELPEGGGFHLGLQPRWLNDEQEYKELRTREYARSARPDWDHVWDGEGRIPDALLTIFRHHDSSTVTLGLQGQVPENTWVIDYPIFERIYYLLVVNFNVFGSAKHQVRTRLYFDLLRMESELNYLRFLPADRRAELRKSWYRGTGASLKRRLVYASQDLETPTAIRFSGGVDPREEFLRGLLERARAVAGRPDHLNRCDSKPCRDPEASPERQEIEDALGRLANLRAAEAPFVLELPELTFLRLSSRTSRERFAYTLTRDRAHMSVAFMMREEARLEPEQDTVTVFRGPLGSYPNFIFDVPAEEVDAFVDGLLGVRDRADFARLVDAYGVRRTHPGFWDVFHFFRDALADTDPLEAGIYDVNRYVNF